MTRTAQLTVVEGGLSLHPPVPPRPDPEIVVDLSRLLSRVLHSHPTGIDRVEMAYASGLLRLAPDRVSFAAVHPAGPHGRLHRPAVIDFLGATAERWETEYQPRSKLRIWSRAARTCLSLTPTLTPPPRTPEPRVYLHLSPRSLERRRLFESVLERERARLVAFVHDVIPIENPEYVRVKTPALFARKLGTVFALASGILVNSEATKKSLTTLAATRRRAAPICAVPLGVPTAPPMPSWGPVAGPSGPYFVVLGTLEPRKNHLLLLQIWRRLIEVLGRQAVPKLVLVGRRGWDNASVFDLLDRTPSFAGVVHEHGRLPDAALRPLLQRARAVLTPSFSEGFGLPVAEALALGVPVVASDLASLRESGGGVPDYLDPLDGLAWANAVLDYAHPDSPMRLQQMTRLVKWRPPSWDDHLHDALAFISEVAR